MSDNPLWRAMHEVLDELERRGEDPEAVADLLALAGPSWSCGAENRGRMFRAGWREPEMPDAVLERCVMPEDLRAWYLTRLLQRTAGRVGAELIAVPRRLSLADVVRRMLEWREGRPTRWWERAALRVLRGGE